MDVIAKLSAIPTNAFVPSIYHPEMGYTYKPNQTVEFAQWHSHFHVNKWGIIDDDDYPIEKPANEYRIIVIGDSFTAGLRAMIEDRIYRDKDQTVAVSITALRNIFAAHRNVRVMLHPQRWDFEQKHLADVLANFERGLSDIHIEHMTSRFPPHPDAAEFDSWFIPNDNHPTDKGARIYAQLVADYLLQEQHSTAGTQ